MPSRKQRRKQAKERRHEYEYVLVDEEGNEVEVTSEDVKSRKDAKPLADTTRGRTSTKAPAARAGRVIQPPSWTRVGKRALIFAPLMFVTVMLLGGKELSTIGVALQTLVLLAIFLPFSYFMDTLTFRAYQRRLNRDRG